MCVYIYIYIYIYIYTHTHTHEENRKTKYFKCVEFIMMESLCSNFSVLLNLHQDFMMEKNCCLNNDGCFIKIMGEENYI